MHLLREKNCRKNTYLSFQSALTTIFCSCAKLLWRFQSSPLAYQLVSSSNFCPEISFYCFPVFLWMFSTTLLFLSSLPLPLSSSLSSSSSPFVIKSLCALGSVQSMLFLNYKSRNFRFVALFLEASIKVRHQKIIIKFFSSSPAHLSSPDLLFLYLCSEYSFQCSV